jgi:hypothetical protein
MELIGTLKEKFNTQEIGEKKFLKREFVIETESNTPYPQLISLQVTQDKCQLLDLYTIGDQVKCQFNLKGRKWDGPQGTKYFNTIDVWRIEKAGSDGQTQVNNSVQNNSQGADDLAY